MAGNTHVMFSKPNTYVCCLFSELGFFENIKIFFFSTIDIKQMDQVAYRVRKYSRGGRRGDGQDGKNDLPNHELPPNHATLYLDGRRKTSKKSSRRRSRSRNRDRRLDKY